MRPFKTWHEARKNNPGRGQMTFGWDGGDTVRIPHWHGDGEPIYVAHVEELADHPRATGYFSTTGSGLCPRCASFSGLDSIASYDDEGMITCENCGKET